MISAPETVPDPKEDAMHAPPLRVGDRVERCIALAQGILSALHQDKLSSLEKSAEDYIQAITQLQRGSHHPEDTLPPELAKRMFTLHVMHGRIVRLLGEKARAVYQSIAAHQRTTDRLQNVLTEIARLRKNGERT